MESLEEKAQRHMEKWWKFWRYNQEAQYGWGTKEQAREYLSHLDSESVKRGGTEDWCKEEYNPEKEEAAGRDAEKDPLDGFNILDELSEVQD